MNKDLINLKCIMFQQIDSQLFREAVTLYCYVIFKIEVP